MKSDYRERAFRFIQEVYPYIDGFMYEPYLVTRRIRIFNHAKSRNVQVRNGCARIALITSDYVIKFDYDEDEVRRIGGCEDEVYFYGFVKKNHMEHLFAEITPVSYMGHKFYIMPRISGIGRYEDMHVEYFLNFEDSDFVHSYLSDMHSGNYGWKNGYPVIVDYALNELRENTNSAPSYSSFHTLSTSYHSSFYPQTSY